MNLQSLRKSLRDLKGATKDIDLAGPDSDAYGQLWAVLMDLGYAEVQQSLDPDYRALGATSCVENSDGCCLDIFNQQVARATRRNHDYAYGPPMQDL